MQPLKHETIGLTTKSRAELESYLQTINRSFTQATYDLLNNNCNNFSDNVCTFLCGKGIPSYIIDLPRIALSTPMGAMLRPMIENMQVSIIPNRKKIKLSKFLIVYLIIFSVLSIKFIVEISSRK